MGNSNFQSFTATTAFKNVQFGACFQKGLGERYAAQTKAKTMDGNFRGKSLPKEMPFGKF